MDSDGGKDWKKKVGFPINYDSGQSSDDDLTREVVVRHPVMVRGTRRSAGSLLQDGGDGADADLLGTTPPRARIRDKEKRRPMHRSSTDVEASLQRMASEARRIAEETSGPSPQVPERGKKRVSLKLLRGRERDWKQEQSRDKADSLPSPGPVVPTLVESCSRFMSLSSRLKCTAVSGGTNAEVAMSRDAKEGRQWREPQLPVSRVSFHSTFSMLINMGNADKSCKRTISREEQVWQNELKDLIWLALQARLAGRSLPQQDAFLCSQRNVIPTVVQNILEYKFVNPYPCPSSDAMIQGGSEDTESQTCLSPECSRCAASIGVAMREVAALLDAFDGAATLYPSSSAAEADQPCLAQPALKNRIRAMCLWYNTALHMRIKMVAMRRMLRGTRIKSARRDLHHLTSSDSDLSRKSSVCRQASHVRFNVSPHSTPTDSTGSDLSAHSAEPADAPAQPDRPGDNEVIESTRREDVVDSGIDSRSENYGDTTPEIVISDSASPASTYGSSTDAADLGSLEDPLQLGPLHELAQLRLLGKTNVPLYREYNHEMLKTQGVRRCMTFIQKICYNMLRKVYLTLLEPEDNQTDAALDEEMKEWLHTSKDDADGKAEATLEQMDENSYELRRCVRVEEFVKIYPSEFIVGSYIQVRLEHLYGCWSPESLSMRLPRYRSHFVLLSCVCMEAVHDILALRLETRPAQPSCLTVKQLIHELKEGLDIATEIRSSFVKYAAAALRGVCRDAGVRADLLQLLRTFDGTVDTAMQQYLSYLSTMSETEAMPRSVIAAEWAFTARLAARAPRAAHAAPAAFVDIACKQLQRLVQRFDEKFASVMDVNVSNESEEGPRYTVYALCRSAQQVYSDEREAVLQAAQSARALAARLPPACRSLRAPLYENLMSLRNCLVRHTEQILEKSRLPADIEMAEWSRDVADSIWARVRELLLQGYKLGFELHREMYRLALAPLCEGGVARRPRPSSLQPTRPRTDHLTRRRPETVLINESTNPLMHKELHRLVNESWGRGPPPPGPAAPAAPARPYTKFLRSESINEDSVFDCRMFENATATDRYRQNELEDLLGVERRRHPGSESVLEEGAERTAEADEAYALEQRWAAQVARAVIEFARCWMSFVMDRCERGRGLRPRWASQGLEFLMLACDPWNTKHLTDEEFEDLKHLMDGCISHVIGSRPAAQPEPPRRPRRRLHSPLPSAGSATSPISKEAGQPTSPPTDADPPSFPHSEHCETDSGAEHSRRVLEAVQRVDAARDEYLRERRAVGRVLAAAVTSYEPKLRQLTFKWQRGLKIGAGTFGKVYTVVNTESGQLLAMKELSVCAGDRRALQRAANELRVLEGVLHPHLVRYYGCELHREEMLLFMELCVEGSLEALLVASGALAELTARRYTKQLVSAVTELHARGIAHRDIKSGNIFLTNEGNCLKLGDFGCAVKIRANTTVPGELQGFVGTQAYMAPEVFMKSSGHGRAADIWSLGCVVTEMASGKRPFSEYDSNYQIMFVVGMGGRPAVPDTLSEEGQEFCRLCLTHDPDQRPRADALALHHFLMMKSDEDCKCEPAYLIT
ncbi:mitogen-activated protein kinase kinase kinase 4 [Battus philenor]|uniref:mitogen-activated protein kinase kinase kinase 4 n=1 Tax=Battus philenor TaxID=42288 RepID=UPI0035CEE3C0